MAFYGPQIALSLAAILFSLLLFPLICYRLISASRRPIRDCIYWLMTHDFGYWLLMTKWIPDLLLVLFQTRCLDTSTEVVPRLVPDLLLRFGMSWTVFFEAGNSQDLLYLF